MSSSAAPRHAARSRLRRRAVDLEQDRLRIEVARRFIRRSAALSIMTATPYWCTAKASRSGEPERGEDRTARATGIGAGRLACSIALPAMPRAAAHRPPRRQLGELPAHAHGHRADLSVELALEHALVDRGPARRGRRPTRRGARRSRRCRRRAQPVRTAVRDEVPQRGDIAHHALLDRRFEAVREREGPDRQHRVAELQQADDLRCVAWRRAVGQRSFGGPQRGRRMPVRASGSSSTTT